jgi:hypothetical protein
LIKQPLFGEEEKLDGPGQVGGMRFMSSMTGAGGTLYKNVKEKNTMLLIRTLWVRILSKRFIV